MAKSMRCKREKRLRAIRREMVEPYYDKKDEAKLAAQEAALAAPKLPVRPPPKSASAMEVTTTDNATASTSNMGMLQFFFCAKFTFPCAIFYLICWELCS
ncbi:unnamed protein product [Prunus armeniaca]